MLYPCRRAALAACLGFAALWLAGCAALLGPRTVEIPEVRLQQLLARQFPLRSRVLELFDINVAAPRLTLLPETNRVSTEFDLAIGDRLLKTPYQGTLALSYGLRYESSDRTVRLADLRIERAELREAGALPGVSRQLDRVGSAVAEKLLGDPIVYALTAKDLETVQGRGYQPSDIRVTPRGLTITLIPEPAR